MILPAGRSELRRSLVGVGANGVVDTVARGEGLKTAWDDEVEEITGGGGGVRAGEIPLVCTRKDGRP